MRRAWQPERTPLTWWQPCPNLGIDFPIAFSPISIASLMLGKFSNGLHERPLHVVRGLRGQPMFEFVSQVP